MPEPTLQEIVRHALDVHADQAEDGFSMDSCADAVLTALATPEGRAAIWAWCLVDEYPAP